MPYLKISDTVFHCTTGNAVAAVSKLASLLPKGFSAEQMWSAVTVSAELKGKMRAVSGLIRKGETYTSEIEGVKHCFFAADSIQGSGDIVQAQLKSEAAKTMATAAIAKGRPVFLTPALEACRVYVLEPGSESPFAEAKLKVRGSHLHVSEPETRTVMGVKPEATDVEPTEDEEPESETDRGEEPTPEPAAEPEKGGGKRRRRPWLGSDKPEDDHQAEADPGTEED
jgi:hypothetical protein